VPAKAQADAGRSGCAGNDGSHRSTFRRGGTFAMRAALRAATVLWHPALSIASPAADGRVTSSAVGGG
jgi:hypothetical protein